MKFIIFWAHNKLKTGPQYNFSSNEILNFVHSLSILRRTGWYNHDITELDISTALWQLGRFQSNAIDAFHVVTSHLRSNRGRYCNRMKFQMENSIMVFHKTGIAEVHRPHATQIHCYLTALSEMWIQHPRKKIGLELPRAKSFSMFRLVSTLSKKLKSTFNISKLSMLFL